MAKTRADLVAEWRKTNPPGLEDRPSIHEMIEKTWAEKGTLKDLFAKVADSWAQNGKPYISVRLTEELRRREDIIGEKAPSEPSMLQISRTTEPVQGKRLTSLHKLIKAFSIAGTHELKLWKLGAHAEMDLDHIEDLVSTLMMDPSNFEIRAQLMRYLHQTAGIRTERLAEMIGASRGSLENWIHGNHGIKNTKIAEKLVKIFLPNFLPKPRAELKKTRTNLLAAITDKPRHLGLSDILAKARASKTQTLVLYSYLFGTDSVMGLSLGNAADLLGQTRKWLTDRYTAKTSTNEGEARKILEICEKKLGAATAEEKEEFIEILTGIKSPIALMRDVKEGKITFSGAAHLMRMRVGISMENLQNDQISRAMFEKVETQERAITPSKATIYADLFFKETDKDCPERAYFISCACGFKPMDKAEIIEKINRREINGLKGIEHLLALKGLRKSEFYQKYGSFYTAFALIKNYRASPDTVRKIAAAVGSTFEDLNILCANFKRRKTAPLPEARTTQNVVTPRAVKTSSSGGGGTAQLPPRYGYINFPPSIE